MSRIESLLERSGLRENPFSLREADLEDRKQQASYFFEHPLFADIIGSGTRPSSVVVFARRGAGKTTFRQEIERLCRDQRPPVTGVLDVAYIDFSRVLTSAKAEGDKLTIADHIDEILRCAVVRLLESIDDERTQALLTLPRGELATLSSYVRTYTRLLDPADYGRMVHRLIQQAAAAHDLTLNVDTSDLLWGADAQIRSQLPPEVQPFTNFLLKLHNQPPRPLEVNSYLALLRDFLDLLLMLGYQSMYVLVDRVDETSQLNTPDAVVAFLRPLLTDIKLLDEPNLAFKFFLPQHLEAYLSMQMDFRPNRLLPRHLAWSNDDLMHLLSRRLQAFSRSSSMQMFCNSELRFHPHPTSAEHPQAHYVDWALVESADHLPRNMILRCQKVFAAYEASSEEDITYADLQAAITADLGVDDPDLSFFAPSRSVASVNSGTLSTVEGSNITDLTGTGSSKSADPRLPGLHIDEYERIWRDGERLSIELPPVEFRLLQYLCAHRYELCRREAIFTAVWGMENQGYTETILAQTVRRLRLALEYDPENPQFILTVPRRGLRLEGGLGV